METIASILTSFLNFVLKNLFYRDSELQHQKKFEERDAIKILYDAFLTVRNNRTKMAEALNGCAIPNIKPFCSAILEFQSTFDSKRNLVLSTSLSKKALSYIRLCEKIISVYNDSVENESFTSQMFVESNKHLIFSTNIQQAEDALMASFKKKYKRL